MIRTEAGQLEHVWGRIERIEADTVVAILASRLVTQRGQTPASLSFPVADLEDWQVFEDDRIVRGGFTTRAMMTICERDGCRVPRAARKMKFVDA